MNDHFTALRRGGGPVYAAFLAAGYREHYSDNGFRNTPYLLQKRVMAGAVTLFFVNVWVYPREDYGERGVGYQPEAQLKLPGERRDTLDLTLLTQEPTPEYVEAVFRQAYEMMACVPYE